MFYQVVFYGIPVAMFISLVFAFVVSSQIGRASSRVKAARDAARAGGGAGYSGYSSGCEEEFHHYTAGEQNSAPYNPHYEQELRSRMETAGTKWFICQFFMVVGPVPSMAVKIK